MSHLNTHSSLCFIMEMYNNISTFVSLRKNKTSTKSLFKIFNDNKNLANGARGKCPKCGQEVCVCGYN